MHFWKLEKGTQIIPSICKYNNIKDNGLYKVTIKRVLILAICNSQIQYAKYEYECFVKNR